MINIFIDFDGTITRYDVGDAMFETFGGKQCLEFIGQYREGKLSAVDCFEKESNACGEVGKNALDAFLDSQEIDPTFVEFISFCRSQHFLPIVLSDGMDYYIQRILTRHGVEDVEFYSNHLDLVPVAGTSTVRLQPSFPYTDEVCDRCACCKRNHMLTLSGEEDVIVYIGEGYSDRCPVRYADVVFAKDDLLRYCRSEGIPHYEYASFGDVVDRLKQLLIEKDRRNGLHKRRQAELARCNVFIGE